MINVFNKLILLTFLAVLPTFGQLLSGTRILSDSSAGAKMCLEELYTNGSDAACIQAPSSIATEFTWTLPNANPTSTTRCLEVTTGGVVQYAAAACGTGGSSLTVEDDDSVPTYASTTTLRFDQDDGFSISQPGANIVLIDLAGTPSGAPVGTGRTISTTSPLGGGGSLAANLTLTCTTCVTTNTTQTISATKSFTANQTLGQFGVHTGLISFINGTTGSAYNWTVNTSGNGVINATILPSIDSSFNLGASASAWFAIYGDYLYATTGILPTTGSAIDIGNSGTRFLNVYADILRAYTRIQADTDGGADLGASGVDWQDLYLNNSIIFNGSPTGTATLTSATYSSGEAIEATALAISSSGSFYARTYSGASVSCTGVTNGWLGIRLDGTGSKPQLEVCYSGAVYTYAAD